MIFSENRYPLFGIMLRDASSARCARASLAESLEELPHDLGCPSGRIVIRFNRRPGWT
jgi:hypothetical protein